jgi:hypothetical protein
MVMLDVIVIFTPGQCDQLDDETLAVNFAATNIERLHSGAIGCTVPGDMIHHIEHHPAVAYVRRVQSYMGSLSA